MTTHRILAICAAIAIAALTIFGCKDNAPSGPTAGLGSLSVTKFVSVGNSITAGYQSNGWFESGQKYSFPNLIAQQLNASGASVTFVQPLWSDPGTPIAGTTIPSQYMILSMAGPIIGPNTHLTAGSPENLTYAAPYNNLAVPGALLYDFLYASDANSCASAVFAQSPNPLFSSTLRLFGTQLQQVRILHPDLVTFWLGNNDILGYATSGGAVLSTPAANFAGLYLYSLDSLRAAVGSSATIVVANIPDVTSIPFFTTIPSQGLVLTATTAAALNTATGNAFGFVAGANGFLAYTGVGTTGTVKKLTSSDYVLLTCPQDSLKLAGWGSLKPIPGQYVLDADEVAFAKSQVAAYNATIAAVAASHNAVVVDINGLLAQINTSGYLAAGSSLTLTSAYVSGGVFSLDGVHPTAKGQGIIANAFIKAINAKTGSSIPLVDVNGLPGIPAPLSKYSIGGKAIPYISPDAMTSAQMLQW